ISYDYALVPFDVIGSSGSEELLGSATTFSGYADEFTARSGHVALDDNGHPIFYESVELTEQLPRGQQWYSVDLIDVWGGKPLASVESVRVRNDNPIYMVVGIATDGDVLVWDRGYTGRWIFRNLTQDLGADPIASDSTIFEDRNLISFSSLAVAGKNAQ